ncbi:fatty-acyl coenzyme A oxidase, partial [Coemansia sp. RSA 2618]
MTDNVVVTDPDYGPQFRCGECEWVGDYIGDFVRHREEHHASIAEERKAPSFPIRELTFWLDGDKKVTELKEQIMLELERDPLWR